MADTTATTLPSPQELAAIGEDTLRGELDPAGTGKVNLRPGSRNAAFISVAVSLYARVARFIADRIKAHNPATAEDADQDVIGHDLYGTDRKPASFCTGNLYLTRPSSRPATYIPKGWRFSVPATNSTPAVTFEAVETVQVALNATTAVVPLQCQETGVKLVKQGDISKIVDELPDTTWTINLSPTSSDPIDLLFSGGGDVETNDEYRERYAARTPQDAKTGGVLRAVQAGVLEVPGIKYVDAIEPADGTMLIYAGDENYGLSSAQRAAILTSLLNWRCFGIPARVRSYDAETVAVTGTIYMNRDLSNYDTAQIRADAIALIKAYFKTGRASAAEYTLDAIRRAAGAARPGEIQKVVLTSPGSDVLRQPDSAYAGVSSPLTRYVTDDSSISITIAAFDHA